MQRKELKLGRPVLAFFKSIVVSIFKAAAKEAFVLGIVAFAFFVPLFVKHPDLPDSTIALSIVLTLVSFWVWSLIVVLILRRLRPLANNSTALSLQVRKLPLYLVIFVVLYWGPSLLAAAVVMHALHLSASAEVAFHMLRFASETVAALCFFVLGLVLASGRESVSVERASIERMGEISLSNQLNSLIFRHRPC